MVTEYVPRFIRFGLQGQGQCLFSTQKRNAYFTTHLNVTRVTALVLWPYAYMSTILIQRHFAYTRYEGNRTFNERVQF